MMQLNSENEFNSENKFNNVNLSDEKKDFLILSYNEGAEDFTLDDCKNKNICTGYVDEVLEKISEENPAFLFVCTQESKASGKTHYQHTLNKMLDNSVYVPLLKVDGSVYTLAKVVKTNKNVRTRIYYNRNRVFNNIITKSYNNTFLKSKSSKFLKKNSNKIINEDETYVDNTTYNKSNLQIENKYIIREVGFYKSKDAGLTKLTKGTIFKGSILTRLEIENTYGERIKFIIVNSHLYFHASNSGNTGLSKRTKQFFDLIDEFKLATYYKKGYNIFFCGDLNFRLSVMNNRISNNTKKISEDIINIFEKEHIRNINKNYQNELYTIIKNIVNKKEESNKELLEKFYENATKFGIHLTCKIHQNSNNTTKSCFRKNLQKGMFNCSHKGTPRIPSMCDKILTAEQNNLLIKSNDFTRLTKLRKSDHFMIALSGKFKKVKNNNFSPRNSNEVKNNFIQRNSIIDLRNNNNEY
jgi:hypothetical protein